MPTPNDVAKIIEQLVATSTNTETLQGQIGKVRVPDSSDIYVLGGDHYVLVCGASEGGAEA